MRNPHIRTDAPSKESLAPGQSYFGFVGLATCVLTYPLRVALHSWCSARPPRVDNNARAREVLLAGIERKDAA